MPDAKVIPLPQREADQSALEQHDSPPLLANARLSHRSGRSLLALGAVIGLFMPAATLIPISGAVIASGETGSEARFKSIVHPTGGILSELLVREGQAIQAGQVLMKFETTVTGPGAQYARESMTSLMVRKARLEAEVAGRSTFDMPKDIPNPSSPEAVQAIDRERSVLAIKRSDLAAQSAMIEDQKRQISAEISGFREQIAAIARQRGLLAPELSGLRDLYRKELVTINRLNEAERNDVSLAGETATLNSRIRQAQARLAELVNRSLSMKETARSAAGNELNEILLTLADGRVRQVGASDALERSVIRAPQAGVVDALAFTTLGSAVPAGQEILRIIPQNDRMVVHAKVAPADIDQVEVGQAARIRFSGFNQQTTPEIQGVVTFVSADRSEDPRSGAPYYRVNVSIDAAAFERQAKLRVSTGMPAEAFITTTSRSLASYMFKPLLDQLSRAFRDEQ
ncbi:HlyD family type I secretion periplasmic adaptor subunit [Novosphingobium sp. MW5]|nr:HlyD family type I secretion periplasmic adaptor subunit [Novosphingobium sp. MW5]